jgi:hypothetical protein
MEQWEGGWRLEVVSTRPRDIIKFQICTGRGWKEVRLPFERMRQMNSHEGLASIDTPKCMSF